MARAHRLATAHLHVGRLVVVRRLDVLRAAHEAAQVGELHCTNRSHRREGRARAAAAPVLDIGRIDFEGVNVERLHGGPAHGQARASSLARPMARASIQAATYLRLRVQEGSFGQRCKRGQRSSRFKRPPVCSHSIKRLSGRLPKAGALRFTTSIHTAPLLYLFVATRAS